MLVCVGGVWGCMGVYGGVGGIWGVYGGVGGIWGVYGGVGGCCLMSISSMSHVDFIYPSHLLPC